MDHSHDWMGTYTKFFGTASASARWYVSGNDVWVLKYSVLT